MQIAVDLEEAKNSGKRFYAPGIQFSGPDADLNRFMHELYWSNRKDRDNISRALSTIKSNRDIPIKKYTQSLDSLYESLAKLDESYIKKNPSTYSWLIKNERLSDYYGELLYQHWGRKMDDTLWAEIKKHTPNAISTNGTNFYNNLFYYLQQLPDKPSTLEFKNIGSLVDLDPEQEEKINEFKDLFGLLTTGKALDTLRFQQLNKELKPVFNSYFFKKKIEKNIAIADSMIINKDSLVEFNAELKENLIEIKNLFTLEKDGKALDAIKLQQLKKALEPVFSSYLSKKRIAKDIKLMDSLFVPVIADFLKLKITSEDLKKQKIIDDMVLNTLQTPWCKEYLQKMAQANIAKLNDIETSLKRAKLSNIGKSVFGKPTMEFDFGAKLYEISDMTAQELLAKIKSSFKDRALLLDFWAVWCGPCLGDFPSSKKLHDAVEDEPVEFIYLCTSAGGSPEQWKAKIAQFKLGGTHLFIEQSVEAELMQLFNGSGFPTYAFINKKGEYKPGSITRMSQISRERLVQLINGK